MPSPTMCKSDRSDITLFRKSLTWLRLKNHLIRVTKSFRPISEGVFLGGKFSRFHNQYLLRYLGFRQSRCNGNATNIWHFHWNKNYFSPSVFPKSQLKLSAVIQVHSCLSSGNWELMVQSSAVRPHCLRFCMTYLTLTRSSAEPFLWLW